MTIEHQAVQAVGKRFDSKVALITGAGGDIGAAIAVALAGEGAAVCVIDIDAERANGVARRITSGGGEALAAHLDVADVAAVDELVIDLERRFGPVDVLVNAAGALRTAPFVELTVDDWEALQRVNVRGTIVVTKAVAPRMIERGSGAIVNISSISGREGRPLTSFYGATKAALIALTQSLAREFGPAGVTINCICPGVVRTAMQDAWVDRASAVRRQTPEEIWRERLKLIPLGRTQDPEDIAEMTMFLASASGRNVTGQAISVCGGMQVT